MNGRIEHKRRLVIETETFETTVDRGRNDNELLRYRYSDVNRNHFLTVVEQILYIAILVGGTQDFRIDSKNSQIYCTSPWYL